MGFWKSNTVKTFVENAIQSLDPQVMATDGYVNISEDEDVEDCVSFSGDSSDSEEDLLVSTSAQGLDWKSANVGADTPVELSDFYCLQGLNPEYEDSKSVSDFVNLFFYWRVDQYFSFFH